MKMNLKRLSGLAAFAAVAFTAQAQTLGLNDISVGFGTNAASNSLEVKVGTVSGLALDTTQTTIGNFNSLLNNLSGTWTSATLSSDASNTLFWGAQGTASSTKVFASSTWDITTAGVLGAGNSTPWALPSVSSGNTKIGGMNSTFGTAAATATGDGLSKTIAAGNANSWTKLALVSPTPFNTFTNPPSLMTVGSDLALGKVYSAADLYQVIGGSSTLLGTFALYTAADGAGHVAGDLTFTAFQAIPEPSTYAAILGLATLGFVAIRRRKQSQLLA